MSRWMMPFWWACWMAWQTWMNKLQPFCRHQAVLVAVVGDRDPAHQLHDKVRAAGLGGAGIEDPGDVGMVHQRQRLALGFEARDRPARIHPQLDHLQRHAAADGLFLLRHVNHPAAAFPDFLQEFVTADTVAGSLAHARGQRVVQALACRFSRAESERLKIRVTGPVREECLPRPGLCGQKAFDFAAQIRIRTTGLS